MDTQKQIDFAESLLSNGLALINKQQNPSAWYRANVLDYGSRIDLPQTSEEAYKAIRTALESGKLSASEIIDNLSGARGVVGEVTLARLLKIKIA